ncbi:MAG: twin-arginine translocation signal domain-containing protein, partial [Tannerella sp.]|nr:twin-arginine translocation signal domain-containing protein [Tannerella sp.]
MKEITRRNFIKASGMTLASGLIAGQIPAIA